MEYHSTERSPKPTDVEVILFSFLIKLSSVANEKNYPNFQKMIQQTNKLLQMIKREINQKKHPQENRIIELLGAVSDGLNASFKIAFDPEGSVTSLQNIQLNRKIITAIDQLSSTKGKTSETLCAMFWKIIQQTAEMIKRSQKNIPYRHISIQVGLMGELAIIRAAETVFQNDQRFTVRRSTPSEDRNNVDLVIEDAQTKKKISYQIKIRKQTPDKTSANKSELSINVSKGTPSVISIFYHRQSQLKEYFNLDTGQPTKKLMEHLTSFMSPTILHANTRTAT